MVVWFFFFGFSLLIVRVTYTWYPFCKPCHVAKSHHITRLRFVNDDMTTHSLTLTKKKRIQTVFFVSSNEVPQIKLTQTRKHKFNVAFSQSIRYFFSILMGIYRDMSVFEAFFSSEVYFDGKKPSHTHTFSSQNNKKKVYFDAIKTE